MTRRWVIFSLLLVVGATVCADTPRPRRAPRNKDGEYNCTIGGYVTGNGNAVVSGGKVSITATGLKGDDGSSGDLTVSNLALTRDNHFSGTGTVLNRSATFSGRIDVPDDIREHAIKGVRLVATFKSSSGQYGRVIGWVQAYADGPAPNDDDKTPPPSTRPSRPAPGGGTPRPPRTDDDDDDRRAPNRARPRTGR